MSNKKKRAQREQFLGGKRFTLTEVTKEEWEKLDPEQEEWQPITYLDDGKKYKTRRTKEYIEAENFEEKIKKEQKNLGISTWVDKNKQSLDEKNRQTLAGNASTIYYNFRINRDLFRHNIITKEQLRDIIFDYLETEDQKRAWQKLFNAEQELEKLKKKPISPEEIEDSFQRLLQKKNIIGDPKLINDLPMIAPPQLDKRHLIEETETSTEIIKKYQRRFGNETITYLLLVPKEEYKKGQIPTFGEHLRKALFIMSAFAHEQKTLSPVFRKEHIFKLEGKVDKEIKGGMYKNLDNALKTIAYITYEIENDKKGKEYRRTIGHITDNISWIGKGRGGLINCAMNRQYWSTITALIEGEKPQFLSIPKDRLTETLPRDEENFLNYIDSLRGLRHAYAIHIKTIFVKKLGYQIKSLKKMGSGEISRIISQCLDRAIKTGRLREPYSEYDYKGNPNFKNILNWKITLFLFRKGE